MAKTEKRKIVMVKLDFTGEYSEKKKKQRIPLSTSKVGYKPSILQNQKQELRQGNVTNENKRLNLHIQQGRTIKHNNGITT